MPSFFKFHGKVERFIQRRAARALRTAQHPMRFAEGAEDLPSLDIGQGHRRSLNQRTTE